MKTKFLLFLMMTAACLGACSTGGTENVEYYDDYYAEYDEYEPGVCFDDYVGVSAPRYVETPRYAQAPRQTEIKYSTPNGNDLKLETPGTVVHVLGAPGKQYAYYVWAGGKQTSDDADLIVRDGMAAILVQE